MSCIDDRKGEGLPNPDFQPVAGERASVAADTALALEGHAQLCTTAPACRGAAENAAMVTQQLCTLAMSLPGVPPQLQALLTVVASDHPRGEEAASVARASTRKSWKRLMCRASYAMRTPLADLDTLNPAALIAHVCALAGTHHIGWVHIALDCAL